MKKIMMFFLGVVLSFAFNVNKTYTCTTLGVSYKSKNGKVMNLPNNAKTQKQIKESLKTLYSIKIEPVKNGLKVYVDGKSDELSYVKTLQHNVKVFTTKTKDVYILTDDKASQIGMSIPSQKMIIYYQCK